MSGKGTGVEKSGSESGDGDNPSVSKRDVSEAFQAMEKHVYYMEWILRSEAKKAIKGIVTSDLLESEKKKQIADLKCTMAASIRVIWKKFQAGVAVRDRE